MKNHIVMFALSFMFIAAPLARSQNPPLQLAMESEKGIYTIGEEMRLLCAIENVSDTTVAFYPYIPQRISLRDARDSACIEEQAQTWESHDSLVTLKPREIYRYTLKGEIQRRTGSISDVYAEGIRRYAEVFKIYYKEVYGIFVNFPGNAYYVRENFGKYKITSHFTDANMLMAYSPINSKEREIDLKNTWRGELTSNAIVIEIVK